MKPVLAILGGSTPFTAALVEALRAAPDGIPACELRLLGQDEAALWRMKRYAGDRLAPLGWTASATRHLEEAAEGASVVVNQIRFGGMEGRARDEALANRFQLPADETLGPCGLTSALRVVPRIRALATELGRRCPDAWVLNLANPLSLTTAAMIDAGAPSRCVGLCELPLATVIETCRLLRMSLADVQWEYAGLNHRGFILSLRHRGEDLMPRLPELLGEETIFGVTAGDIRRAGALPLKYFRLLAVGQKTAPARRAEFLCELKDAIAREMDQSPGPPSSLSMRDLGWYRGAVVPMLAAIFAGDGRRMVVDCLGDDGLVWERLARVTRSGVEPIATEPTPAARPFIDRWVTHERALLEAVAAPSLESIEHALQADPVVPESRVRELAGAVWAEQGS